MKKLKLDHDFAQRVANGEKRNTWRLFDDKDLSVNDDVELIDKVQSNKPETWRSIGVAHITKVIEKRIMDISENDLDDHEQPADIAKIVGILQQYYGPNVAANTPVKMIYFDFVSNSVGSLPQKMAKVDAVKLYADGGSRGNPGPSASGYVIVGMDDQVVVDKGVYLGVTTNNQAEYQALKFALEEAQKMHVQRVDVYMDSLLVINQMKGIFKVKNRDLWPIHDSIRQLAKSFEHITFTQVPRELNKLADAAVNRALDEALRK